MAEASQDAVLLKASKFEVDPVMAMDPLPRDLDHAELLLSLALGQSDAEMSKKFLVERLKIAAMRHDLERRYQTMFRWLDHFRGTARAKDFAMNGDLRKYIDGLRSSDIARREQALEHAVRWLIRY